MSDGILIKDNHLAFVPAAELLRRAKESRSPLHGIEIEVQDLNTLAEVLKNPPDVIMLDNFSLEALPAAIRKIRESSGSRIEVSGGVSLENVRNIAELRPDYISVGALTHSVRSLNLTMDYEVKR